MVDYKEPDEAFIKVTGDKVGFEDYFVTNCSQFFSMFLKRTSPYILGRADGKVSIYRGLSNKPILV